MGFANLCSLSCYFWWVTSRFHFFGVGFFDFRFSRFEFLNLKLGFIELNWVNINFVLIFLDDGASS